MLPAFRSFWPITKKYLFCRQAIRKTQFLTDPSLILATVTVGLHFMLWIVEGDPYFSAIHCYHEIIQPTAPATLSLFAGTKAQYYWA